MIYLIYWYGSKSDSDFYGFVSKSNFYTYEQESAKGAKGIHVLPSKLQEKMNDTSTKLATTDEDTIRTYQEVEEDLLKEPSDRKRGVLSFLEGYDMLSYEDLDEIDVDDSSSGSSSDSSDDSDKNEKEEPSNSKKTKPIVEKSTKADIAPSKKVKKKLVTKTVLEEIDSKPKKSKKHDGDTVGVPSDGKVSSKSTPIDKKRRRIGLDAEDSLLTATAEKKKKKPKKDTTTGSTIMQSKKLLLSSPPVVPMNDSAAAVLSDGIGENDDDDDDDVEETSADDESSAEMEHEDGDIDDDDDKDDLDFIEKVVVPQKETKTKQAKLKKVKVVKKEQKVKVKVDLPKTDKQLKRKETEEFRKCEEQYARLISKWETAIKNENVDRLQRILLEADSVVSNFCSSFMISYNLSTIIKDTKAVLKKSNQTLTGFLALKEKFKQTFETKRLLVPKGYIIPKRSYPQPVTTTSKKSNENSNMDVSEHTKPKDKATTDVIQSKESSFKNVSQSSTSSITLKGTPSAGIGVSNTLGVARPTAQTSTGAAPKFKALLGNILQQQQQQLTSSQSSSNMRDEAKSIGSMNNLEQLPSWATASGSTVDEIPPIPQDNDTRLLALEFLIQVAQLFPEGLINIDALSRSLEDAIYKWAQSTTNKNVVTSTTSEVEINDSSWIKIYWRKVHAIVAAFSGSTMERGTFYSMLRQGKFSTPHTIVTASDDKYVAAFEGKAVKI